MQNEAMSRDEGYEFGPDVVALYERRFAYLRKLIEGLDEEALGWRPGPETSSISNLVLHIAGAVPNGFRIQVGAPRERDRDPEFSTPTLSAAELIARLDAAEREVAEYRDRIGLADLTEIRERPARGQAFPGIQVLLIGFGHLTEHTAQIAMTRQLYEQRVGEAAGGGGGSAG